MKNGATNSGTVELRCKPIGVIRTNMRLKFEAPHQPKNASTDQNVIELYSKNNFELALKDVATFDRIWVIWWFHKNLSWKPTVLPPRGHAQKRGVFATRSPHRPNPIGITAVPLLGVRGREIFIGNSDLLDGTPILDIKPYISTVDSFPESKLGWIEDVEKMYTGDPKFSVQLGERATAQIEWLRTNWKVDFIDRARQILELDPSVHRTRRISRIPDTSASAPTYKIGCGAWRAIFTVNDDTITIIAVTAGYPKSSLENSPEGKIPDREAQIAFNAAFP